MPNINQVLAPGEVLTVTADAAGGTVLRRPNTPGGAAQSDAKTLAASASVAIGPFTTQTTWQMPATFTHALSQATPVYANANDGVTTGSSVVRITETVAFGDFTDGGSTVGTYAITKGTIPAGATFLHSAVPSVVGFAGDTSAVLTIGDGTDVDRYNTGTIDVFTTAAGGVAAGAPSGTTYHDAAKTVTLTITTASDWGGVTAGSLTVELYYTT